MYHYELHQEIAADMLRKAEQERLARSVVRGKRAARASRKNEGEGRVSQHPVSGLFRPAA
jgi:hypothetical protein